MSRRMQGKGKIVGDGDEFRVDYSMTITDSAADGTLVNIDQALFNKIMAGERMFELRLDSGDALHIRVSEMDLVSGAAKFSSTGDLPAFLR